MKFFILKVDILNIHNKDWWEGGLCDHNKVHVSVSTSIQAPDVVKTMKQSSLFKHGNYIILHGSNGELNDFQ